MPKGYNKADEIEKIEWLFETLSKNNVKKRPCVFLSHKKEDKKECRKIAEYFKEARIDYYLDELDLNLQQASLENNLELITESIKKGIRESTHMLVIVSEKTYRSQWVPFEVGYGHSAILDKGLDEKLKEKKIKLSVLTLKDISEKSLPGYLQVAHIIRGIESLNRYISKISSSLEKTLVLEGRILSSFQSHHPLDDVLNWKL